MSGSAAICLRREAGAPFLRFVLPSDVRALKDRLNPFVASLDASIASCATVSAAKRASWADWRKAWAGFFAASEGFWSAGAEMDQGEAYEIDFRAWRDFMIAQRCAADAPAPTKTDAPSGPGADTGETVRTVAIAAVILGALYLALQFSPRRR